MSLLELVTCKYVSGKSREAVEAVHYVAPAQFARAEYAQKQRGMTILARDHKGHPRTILPEGTAICDDQ